MAYTPEEYEHILKHLQRTLQKQDPALYEILAGSRDSSSLGANTARERMIAYLRRLIGAVRESSRTGYDRALDGFSEYVRAGDGEGIEGIYVDFSEADESQYGRAGIDLGECEDKSEVVRKLEAILCEVEEAGEDSP